MHRPVSHNRLTVNPNSQSECFGPLIAASFINANEVSLPIAIGYSESEEDSISVNLNVDGKHIVISGYDGVLGSLAETFTSKLCSHQKLDEMHRWIQFAARLQRPGNGNDIPMSLAVLNEHLLLRGFICGYTVSLADMAVWGALRGNKICLNHMRKTTEVATYANVLRWYNLLESYSLVTDAIEAMTKELALRSKSTKTTKKNKFGVALQEAVDGKVVTRFPPEPSGYLHIGHAKAALLNQYFAQEYHGKLIVRFDDTNPSKEKMEYQEAILQDLELLGVKPQAVSYSSDFFDEMYKCAIQLIKSGNAYTDDTDQMRMRAERMDGIASARRERSVEDNLRIFTEMTNGTEEGLKNCLRARISVDNPNKALRDPVIYRCNLLPHHRTGSQWKVYPTYDFCCPILDAIEGVTHALRTIEYHDRNAQYQWMLDSLGLRRVHIWDFSRINFVRTLLSKRKLQKLVDKGIVWGWDDPRFPTVRGVRRRGMTVEGLKQFILMQGPSKNVINLDWTSIWAVNKKIIDPIAPRHVALAKNNAVISRVQGGPATVVEEHRPQHKKNPDLGNKPVQFSSQILIDQEDAQTFDEGEEITLMDWGNVFVRKISKNPQGDLIIGLNLQLHLEGDFKLTKKKVTWLADTPQNVAAELVNFDHLLTKDKLDENDNWEDFLTLQTEFRTAAITAMSTSSLQKGDIIQFERKGYYRLDEVGGTNKPAQFFSIPDGKTVTKYGAKKD